MKVEMKAQKDVVGQDRSTRASPFGVWTGIASDQPTVVCSHARGPLSVPPPMHTFCAGQDTSNMSENNGGGRVACQVEPVNVQVCSPSAARQNGCRPGAQSTMRSVSLNTAEGFQPAVNTDSVSRPAAASAS